MIAYLEGQIKYKGKDFLILETRGIGYKIFISLPLLVSLKEDDNLKLFTHQRIADDKIDLYGFKTLVELNFFEKLIGISGIGPKSALGILSIASVDDIKRAIIQNDSSILTKVSGIGKRTAERIIVEMKDRIEVGDLTPGQKVGVEDEVLEALRNLGYSRREAQEILARIPPEIKDPEAKIKEALKILGGRK